MHVKRQNEPETWARRPRVFPLKSIYLYLQNNLIDIELGRRLESDAARIGQVEETMNKNTGITIATALAAAIVISLAGWLAGTRPPVVHAQGDYQRVTAYGSAGVPLHEDGNGNLYANVAYVKLNTSYVHITGTSATAVPGNSIIQISVNTPAPGTIGVFDLDAGSCTGSPSTNTIGIITTTTSPGQTASFNASVHNGICVKASAAMDLTVVYQ
jgi:hypothetical protein